MKTSNRILGLFILISIIGAFYIFYQVFFKIKLVSLEINTNVSSFSGSLENIKFSKDFVCKDKVCIINDLPQFDYKLKLFKKGYESFNTKINLKEKSKININLKKNIFFEKIEEESISLREKILNKSKNKILFSGTNQYYKHIYGINDLVYFKKGDKLYFYNLENKKSFFIKFVANIVYIKKIEDNVLLITTKQGSYVFNVLNKEITYFSLFSDFLLINDFYVGILNSNDKLRKNNFNIENEKGGLIVLYDLNKKYFNILKRVNFDIIMIYKSNDNIIIQDKKGNKYLLKGL